jgi:hypothetical protein
MARSVALNLRVGEGSGSEYSGRSGNAERGYPSVVPTNIARFDNHHIAIIRSMQAP